MPEDFGDSDEESSSASSTEEEVERLQAKLTQLEQETRAQLEAGKPTTQLNLCFSDGSSVSSCEEVDEMMPLGQSSSPFFRGPEATETSNRALSPNSVASNRVLSPGDIPIEEEKKAETPPVKKGAPPIIPKIHASDQQDNSTPARPNPYKPRRSPIVEPQRQGPASTKPHKPGSPKPLAKMIPSSVINIDESSSTPSTSSSDDDSSSSSDGDESSSSSDDSSFERENSKPNAENMPVQDPSKGTFASNPCATATKTPKPLREISQSPMVPPAKYAAKLQTLQSESLDLDDCLHFFRRDDSSVEQAPHYSIPPLELKVQAKSVPTTTVPEADHVNQDSVDKRSKPVKASPNHEKTIEMEGKSTRNLQNDSSAPDETSFPAWSNQHSPKSTASWCQQQSRDFPNTRIAASESLVTPEATDISQCQCRGAETPQLESGNSGDEKELPIYEEKVEETLDQNPEIPHFLYAPPEYQPRKRPDLYKFNQTNRPLSSRPQIAVEQLFQTPVCNLWKDKFVKFNALQSELADPLCRTDSNIIVSAPTGAGKTAIFEMAMARLIVEDLACSRYQPRTFSKQRKIVYIAPSKALCEERFQDWTKRFSSLNLGVQVSMITGDGADAGGWHQELAASHLILTTPEKWDSITRKWVDHFFLLASVKLLMIDEVHLLGDDSRGPCLEAVVTRMKTIERAAANVNASQDQINHSSYRESTPASLASKMRIIAVSATLPNIVDVAEFMEANEAFAFDGSFRPVPLTKHVHGCGFLSKNEFKFWSYLDNQVPDLIHRFSSGKQTLIFCHTKGDTEKLCSALISRNMGGKRNVTNSAPPGTVEHCVLNGVAYHHAGMPADDKARVEEAFAAGEIRCLCATSTLAVGVNLPAHLVIVKGTRAWRGGGNGYQDIDKESLLQMIGRAGRPGLDTSGVAIIMTDNKSKSLIESRIQGLGPAESRLLRNLVDVLATEISQRVITNIDDAARWLKTTFLFIRMRQDASKYAMDKTWKSIDSYMHHLLCRAIKSLAQTGLVQADDDDSITAMPACHIMSVNMIPYDSMTATVSVPFDATKCQILKLLAKMENFDCHLRRNEKKHLNEYHKSTNIKFHLDGPRSKVRVQAPWEKAYLLLQAYIGGQEPFPEFSLNQQMTSFANTALRMLQAAQEYCLKGSKNGQAALQCMKLRRSLHFRMWDKDDGVLNQIPHMSQEVIGRLRFAGISSFQNVQDATDDRLEAASGRSNPFGRTLKDLVSKILKSKLRLSAKIDFATGSNIAADVLCTLEFSDPAAAAMSNSQTSEVTYSLIVYTDRPGSCMYYREGITKPASYRFTPPPRFGKLFVQLVGSLIGLDQTVMLKGNDAVLGSNYAEASKAGRFVETTRQAQASVVPINGKRDHRFQQATVEKMIRDPKKSRPTVLDKTPAAAAAKETFIPVTTEKPHGNSSEVEELVLDPYSCYEQRPTNLNRLSIPGPVRQVDNGEPYPRPLPSIAYLHQKRPTAVQNTSLPMAVHPEEEFGASIVESQTKLQADLENGRRRVWSHGHNHTALSQGSHWATSDIHRNGIRQSVPHQPGALDGIRNQLFVNKAEGITPVHLTPFGAARKLSSMTSSEDGVSQINDVNESYDEDGYYLRNRENSTTWKNSKRKQQAAQKRAFATRSDNPFAFFEHDPNDSESFLDGLSKQNKNKKSPKLGLGQHAEANFGSRQGFTKRRRQKKQPSPREILRQKAQELDLYLATPAAFGRGSDRRASHVAQALPTVSPSGVPRSNHTMAMQVSPFGLGQMPRHLRANKEWQRSNAAHGTRGSWVQHYDTNIASTHPSLAAEYNQGENARIEYDQYDCGMDVNDAGYGEQYGRPWANQRHVRRYFQRDDTSSEPFFHDQRLLRQEYSQSEGNYERSRIEPWCHDPRRMHQGQSEPCYEGNRFEPFYHDQRLFHQGHQEGNYETDRTETWCDNQRPIHHGQPHGHFDPNNIEPFCHDGFFPGS